MKSKKCQTPFGGALTKTLKKHKLVELGQTNHEKGTWWYKVSTPL